MTKDGFFFHPRLADWTGYETVVWGLLSLWLGAAVLCVFCIAAVVCVSIEGGRLIVGLLCPLGLTPRRAYRKVAPTTVSLGSPPLIRPSRRFFLVLFVLCRNLQRHRSCCLERAHHFLQSPIPAQFAGLIIGATSGALAIDGQTAANANTAKGVRTCRDHWCGKEVLADLTSERVLEGGEGRQ
jgi:hypothetical protein